MKMSNFCLNVSEKKGRFTFFYAEVDIETGFFRKTKKRVKIFREECDHWCFSDSGKYIDIWDINPLVRQWNATHKTQC